MANEELTEQFVTLLKEENRILREELAKMSQYSKEMHDLHSKYMDTYCQNILLTSLITPREEKNSDEDDSIASYKYNLDDWAG